MKAMEIVPVGLVLCFLSYASAAGVTKCWGCNTAACNDPFNASNAVVVNCSNIQSYRSATVGEFDDAADALFDKYNALYTPDTEFVCLKYMVNAKLNGNYNFTVRQCSPKVIGNLNTCDAVSQTVGPTLGPVLSCITCDGDLCNSASRWSFSVLAAMVFVLLGYWLS